MSGHIQISDGDECYHIPVENGIISLSLVKTYFPETVSLTYEQNNKIYAVKIKADNEDKIEIVPGVLEYNVFKHKTSSTHSYINEAKQRRIDEIMAVVDKKGGKDKSEIFVPKVVTKQVIVGWKKFNYVTNKFKQVLTLPGGNKVIELNKATKISYERLLNLAIDAMKNEDNADIFEHSSIQLGNYQDEAYPQFNDFWKFAKKIKSSNREIRIYLLTKGIPLEDSNEMEKCDQEKDRFKVKESPFSKNKAKSNERQSPVKPIISQEVSFNSSQFSESKENTTPNNNLVLSQSSNLSSIGNTSENRNCLSYYVDDNSLSKKVRIVTKATSQYVLDTYKIEELPLSVPVLNMDELCISTNVLGSGTYGYVIKGNWLGTDVAIKRIDLNVNNKYILREIKLMNGLRHCNLTSIMAVMFEHDFAYIIMELFDGLNLRHVLYQNENVQEYQLTEELKNWIAFQICTAISFLHERRVIHKDIKLDNIMVNESYDIKLCDLGLSSTDTMPVPLQTTCGHTFFGTVSYMAPEVFISSQPATEKSDVWSLACTVIEIYNEMYVWGTAALIDRDVLTNMLKSNLKPDCKKCPIIIQNIISCCFERDPCDRPKANTLLDLFRCISKRPRLSMKNID